MTVIEKLRYVRLGVHELGRSADFATRIVGLQPIDAPEGVAMFRSDYRDHTLELYASSTPEQTVAVEVRTPADLEAAIQRLQAVGYTVHQADKALCDLRRCKAMAWFVVRGALRVEMVVRPMHSGWRYFPSRDAGITEFFGIALASTDVEADLQLWTQVFNGRITDYVGDAVYIAIDDQHHRIAIHPSTTDHLLEVQFRLEGLHEVMQNKYFLQSAQVLIAHGPGRRPTSGQVFVSFRGPDGVMFGFVAEGDTIDPASDRLPRQFARAPGSFCAWGSMSDVPEFN
jgi:2,3-dihydroxy-p-cumate/2,3-dihydroxybenzoate 3,4-dioxygenase